MKAHIPVSGLIHGQERNNEMLIVDDGKGDCDGPSGGTQESPQYSIAIAVISQYISFSY
jgi:hypothetical protein